MGQYTAYSSADAGAPALDGQVGSLITVLDKCLVDGYGAKVAAGWTHPVATAGNIASYKQGAGCGFGMVINDNGPNVTPGAREAWATGWESVAGVGSPVGSGSGQFPTAAQLLTTGHVVIRKSTAASAVTRQWRVYADASTVFLITDTGDQAGFMHTFMFGDVYSLAGVGDLYRCIIQGKNTENTSGSANCFDFSQVRPGTASAGKFMARTYSGAGSSILVAVQADNARNAADGACNGILQAPNGTDNSYWMAPWTVAENSSKAIRGRLRGFYQLLHDRATFADGQVLTGGGDYAGKTFHVVRDVGSAPSTQGAIAVEVSATLETNA